MSWNAAGDWLASHGGGGAFHGPAPYTPDGPPCPDCGAPEGVGCDCPPDNPDDAAYLEAWRAAVDRGEFEESGNLSGYWITDMIPGITYSDYVRGKASSWTR